MDAADSETSPTEPPTLAPLVGSTPMEDLATVLAAVKKDGRALEHASTSLKGDRNVVLAAMKTSHGRAIQHASDALLADRQFIIEAISQDGGALRYVPEQYCDDKEVVLAAVRQFGFALAHASEALKVDRDVVLAARKENGRIEGPHRRFRGWTPQAEPEMGDDDFGLESHSMAISDPVWSTEYRVAPALSLSPSQSPRGRGVRPPARKPSPTKRDPYLSSAQSTPRGGENMSEKLLDAHTMSPPRS